MSEENIERDLVRHAITRVLDTDSSNARELALEHLEAIVPVSVREAYKADFEKNPCADKAKFEMLFKHLEPLL